MLEVQDQGAKKVPFFSRLLFMLQMASFWLCFHMPFPLCMHSFVSSSSHKDTTSIGLDPYLITLIYVKTLESPLNSKEIKQTNPKENQPGIFIGRTDAEAEAPTIWPSDVKT